MLFLWLVWNYFVAVAAASCFDFRKGRKVNSWVPFPCMCVIHRDSSRDFCSWVKFWVNMSFYYTWGLRFSCLCILNVKQNGLFVCFSTAIWIVAAIQKTYLLYVLTFLASSSLTIPLSPTDSSQVNWWCCLFCSIVMLLFHWGKKCIFVVLWSVCVLACSCLYVSFKQRIVKLTASYFVSFEKSLFWFAFKIWMDLIL